MKRVKGSQFQACARHPLLLASVLCMTSAVSGHAFALGAGPVSPTVTTPRVSADPRIVDLGVAAPGDVKNITVTLAVRNQAALEAFVASVANPRSPNFRQFITPAQFAAAYGQSPAAVAQVVGYLQSQGFTITKVHANNLLVSVQGTNAQIAATFGTAVHNYSLLGATYQAPSGKAAIPAAIAGVATAVTGLSTQSQLRKHTAVIPNTGALAGDVPAVATSLGGVPGQYTVTDLAAKYDINPLYGKGITGTGRTIGIATLAGYLQSDAYAYWSALGLPVNPNRITDVLVDGGALPADGPGSEGSGESTLDVEQSGGVAPGANMRVYIAPNTNSGFIDVFSQAINENLVDVLSVSWGSPEIAYDSPTLGAFHVLFLQAGSQGIPVIAAAGDAGAFDINRDYSYPNCSTLLTVDYPASDSAVLAAGGTTLPNTVQHRHGPVTVPTERAWGWDYLQNYIITNYGNALYYASYYTVGGGGGVSVNFGVPAYQAGLYGMKTSASAQSLICSAAFIGSGTGYQDLIDMPAGVAGRNVPDVALNADPYSGYLVYQGGWGAGSGGTSFVAPQLNGILTLISSGLPGRVGPINPQLYTLFQQYGYGSGSPFRAITSGDNEYYPSTPSYNPATGLGSLDVNALATALGVH
ncbi:MAG: S8/S53 family peptidase [Burkholderiaceae bacterium]|nr:S8/S53 family peptidase [Roseateles sp.]MBV8470431.1 S8/S53 family peptidase [Burkholderiaceae bacterium]